MVCQAILIIFLLSDYIMSWFFVNEFNEMYLLIFPLSFAIGIQGINSMLEASIHLSKKTNWILLTNLIYLVCFSSLLVWDDITLIIIVLTICFSSIIKFVLTYIISNKVYKIKWDLRQVVTILLSTLLFGLSTLNNQTPSPMIILTAFVFNIIIFLVYNLRQIKLLAFNLINKKLF